MNTPPLVRSFRSISIAVGLTGALGFAAAITAEAQTVNLVPSKDNTLYEFVPEEGDRSNGAGNRFFVGRTNQALVRRGLVAFDVAGSIPPGATITSASLSMEVSRSVSSGVPIALRKLLADWGEGTSNAGDPGGVGAPASTGDATWRHRFFSSAFWATQGGDFTAASSAAQSVGGIGRYTWTSAQMAADVRSWLDTPASNFGWLVLGDESTNGTAKAFNSRESTTGPVLTVQFAVPVDATQVVSRKIHGNANPFDVNLPRTGNPGIECRTGGASGDYQLVFTFGTSVTFSGAAVSAGTGMVSSTSGNGTTAITVGLTGVTTAQRITVTLSGVSNGSSTNNVSAQMGVLVGDTNGDGVVNTGDAIQVRSRAGEATNANNFRADANTDGFVNSGDAIIVRARSGAALP